MTTTIESTANTVVTRLAAIYPRIADVPNTGIQKMIAMTLVGYQALGIEGDSEDLYDQAYGEVMGMYAESDNAAKLLKDEKEKQTAAAFDGFIAAHSKGIIDAALSVPAAYRPTIGWRILVSYDTNPVDPKSGDVLTNDEKVALDKVPATIQFVPLNVKRVGQSDGSRQSSGSGRTAGVFRLEGTSDNVLLADVAKSAGKPETDKGPARAFLEAKGYTIDSEATDGVKYIHLPKVEAATGK